MSPGQLFLQADQGGLALCDLFRQLGIIFLESPRGIADIAGDLVLKLLELGLSFRGEKEVVLDEFSG